MLEKPEGAIKNGQSRDIVNKCSEGAIKNGHSSRDIVNKR